MNYYVYQVTPHKKAVTTPDSFSASVTAFYIFLLHRPFREVLFYFPSKQLYTACSLHIQATLPLSYHFKTCLNDPFSNLSSPLCRYILFSSSCHGAFTPAFPAASQSPPALPPVMAKYTSPAAPSPSSAVQDPVPSQAQRLPLPRRGCHCTSPR